LVHLMKWMVKSKMKFRVSIYWNSPHIEKNDANGDNNNNNVPIGYGTTNPFHKKRYGKCTDGNVQTQWTEVDVNEGVVYVPPVSILNAVDFDFVGWWCWSVSI
jgi:hypothetical protein